MGEFMGCKCKGIIGGVCTSQPYVKICKKQKMLHPNPLHAPQITTPVTITWIVPIRRSAGRDAMKPVKSWQKTEKADRIYRRDRIGSY